jgi:para-aminobenzoate synthetase/4-amino-4-deoxychorismate lyase
MRIIRELERFPRGAYTGTIGLLTPGGDCVFNVAIRTVVIDTQSKQATFGVGGGVTTDSTAEREYEECLVKSRFLQNPAMEFQLFESMLLEEGEYFLLAEHLERLRNSAEYFGFKFPEEEIRSTLADVVASGAFKVRLTLWKNGRIETHVSRLKRFVDLSMRLATTPVDSSDRFLFHKTTLRDFSADVVFWNERGEVTESGIANIVVSIDGQLYTPPVASGLLAGTFRNHLLAQGKIKERVITVEELPEEFFLINSVRKWMRTRITRIEVG